MKKSEKEKEKEKKQKKEGQPNWAYLRASKARPSPLSPQHPHPLFISLFFCFFPLRGGTHLSGPSSSPRQSRAETPEPARIPSPHSGDLLPHLTRHCVYKMPSSPSSFPLSFLCLRCRQADEFHRQNPPLLPPCFL
jgi:hypothetical protein